MTALAAAIVAGTVLAAPALPEVQLTPSLRTSYFSGYTWYEIEGIDGVDRWRSRLTFPINNIRLDAEVSARCSEVVELELGGWTTLDEDAGTMQDDDFTNGVRDVWSRSEAALEAWGLEGAARFWVLREEEFELGPTIRAAYDRLDYDITNVRQFALDPADRVSVDGLVLTYRQERLSFPLGVAAAWRPQAWLEFQGDLGLSFFTLVWDEDDHLLRDKRSQTEGLAFSVPVRLTVDVILADTVRLGIFGDLFYLRTWWAQQDQEFYAGPSRGIRFEDIEADIERLSYAVGARLAVSF